MMKIHSYWAEVPELKSEDEFRLTLLWRARWEAAGFEPVILNEFIARKHPLFAALDAEVSKRPTTNPKAYEAACHHRWLALAQVGGGWMSDLDVLPNIEASAKMAEFEKAVPETYYSGHFHVFQTNCCPSLVYADKMAAQRFCESVICGTPGHSDQYCLESLLTAKADWVKAIDFVKQYPDAGWETAAAVHFPNASLTPRGLTPRWKMIPTLLK